VIKSNCEKCIFHLLHHKRKPPSLNSGYQVLIPKIILGKHGGEEGMIDFMNERKLMDLVNSWDYVPSYEDKDGDWMLVGDVPWPYVFFFSLINYHLIRALLFRLKFELYFCLCHLFVSNK